MRFRGVYVTGARSSGDRWLCDILVSLA
jgi:hypothetical protein